jgi:hypothetical protein
MAIIWNQPSVSAEDEIEKIIEEAEQAYEVREEVEEEAAQSKSPLRGFGN